METALAKLCACLQVPFKSIQADSSAHYFSVKAAEGRRAWGEIFCDKKLISCSATVKALLLC